MPRWSVNGRPIERRGKGDRMSAKNQKPGEGTAATPVEVKAEPAATTAVTAAEAVVAAAADAAAEDAAVAEAAAAKAAAAEAPDGAPPAAGPPAARKGAYGVWPLNRNGDKLKWEWVCDPTTGKKLHLKYDPDPNDHNAVDIFFGVKDSEAAPPKEQMELQDAIGQVLEAIKQLYLHDNGDQSARFRIFYVRLFSLAQLGLEGNAMPEVAAAALERVVDDLIRLEGPRVKNMHLKALGKAAAKLGAGAVAAYLVLRFDGLQNYLAHFKIDGPTASNFMLVWAGCFIGVWLSYAIRKSILKLRDLTVTEEDFLEPTTRLVFAGFLANIVAILLHYGAVKLSIGPLDFNAFSMDPMIAGLLGMVLGVNELLLPTKVGDKTKTLLDKL